MDNNYNIKSGIERRREQDRLKLQKQAKYKKIVATIAVAIAITGGISTGYIQHANMEEANQIVASAQVPAELTQGRNIKVCVNANGTCYYVEENQNGNIEFSKLDNISANDMAERLGLDTTNTLKETKEAKKETKTFDSAKELYTYLYDAGLDDNQIDEILASPKTTMEKESGKVTIDTEVLDYWTKNAAEAYKAKTM